MSAERRGTEILVGLFLLIGFGCIGAMVLAFGKSGGGIQKYYPLTVEFPNASGIIKGSDVLLSGARVGRVAEPPLLLPGNFRVQVKLEIRNEIHIPRTSGFIVGSSGLLGDRFVDVRLQPGYDPNAFYQPGERISGTHAGGGLDELTNKGGAVMDQLQAELEHIQQITQRLNEGLLNDKNLSNIEQTFANLRATTEKFKETSQSLDSLVEKAGATVDATKGTIQTAQGAATDLRGAIADARKAIGDVSKTLSATSDLVKKAQEGGGPLGTLINDRKMAEDLKIFVGNLRRSGVLFYRDRPLLSPTPAPPRR